jgi:hypothetical protein
MRSEKIRKGMAAMAIGAMLSAQMAAPIAWAKSNGSGEAIRRPRLRSST